LTTRPNTRARAEAPWAKVQAEAKQESKHRGDSRARKDFDRCLEEFLDRLAHVSILDPSLDNGAGRRRGLLLHSTGDRQGKGRKDYYLRIVLAGEQIQVLLDDVLPFAVIQVGVLPVDGHRGQPQVGVHPSQFVERPLVVSSVALTTGNLAQ